MGPKLLIIRSLGSRASCWAAVALVAASVFYFTRSASTPPPDRIYGSYHALQSTAELFAGYAILAAIAALWMRYLSRKLVVATATVFPLIVLNTAFLWTSGVLGYVLLLVPTWVPQGPIVAWLSLIQFPTVRAALDYYYAGWLGVLFLLVLSLMTSAWPRRIIRSLEVIVLAVLPLPVEVFLFDRREFFIHVVDAQIRTPFQWFTNFDLLASMLAALLGLIAMERLILTSRLGERLARAG